MSPADPDNSALDALYRRALDHPEARAALFEAMLEHELYTLIPRGQSTRPADQVQRPAPERKFSLPRWGKGDHAYYFIYTSAAQARRGLREAKSDSSQSFLIAGMPGHILLRRLHQPGVGLCINPAKGGVQLRFNDKVLEAILDGTFFEPAPSAPEHHERGSARPLTAEEYPLALVQPVFDHLKTRPEVMAAWVLAPDMYWDRGEKFYVFALLSTAEDTTALCHSVQTVLTLVDASAREGMDFAITTLDYADPSIAAMMRNFPPFYAAPGYQPAGE